MVEASTSNNNNGDSLEDLVFGGNGGIETEKSKSTQNKNSANKSESSTDKSGDSKRQEDEMVYDGGYDSYGEDECDENGDVAICEDCSKVVPASKIDKHKTYFCEMRMAECPLCNESYPMLGMEEHMDHCEDIIREKDVVKCMICGRKMKKHEL